MLTDADWCSNKVQPGFLLSERTSGASPVIFIFIGCQECAPMASLVSIWFGAQNSEFWSRSLATIEGFLSQLKSWGL